MKSFFFPWWLSGLRIQHCLCYSSDYCCGMGLIPGSGMSTCLGQTSPPQKKGKTHFHFAAVWIQMVWIASRSPGSLTPVVSRLLGVGCDQQGKQ